MAGVKKGSVRDNATPVQVWLRNERHHVFKVLCTIEDVKMSDKAQELIEEWIKKVEAERGLTLVKLSKE